MAVYNSNVYNSSVYTVPGGSVAIVEARAPSPDRQGGPIQDRVTVTFTALPTTSDTGQILPLPTGCRVTTFQAIVTTAAGGTTTMSVGNATSATAYLSAVSIASTGVITAPTQAVLEAAAAGASQLDSVRYTIPTATTPSAAPVIAFTIMVTSP